MSGTLSLREAYKDYFDIGAAVTPQNVVTHRDLILQNFSSLTCENQMKYESIQPEEGHFTFEDADVIVNFAKENGLKVRGHAPVWHSQTPNWFFMDGGRYASRELIYERLETHMKAFAAHFGDAVYAYDVVNEATIDSGRRVPPFAGLDVYRQTQYLTMCGIDYLTQSFRIMAEAAPNARLFYNDYNEYIPEKRARIKTLIRNIRENGGRVDGMGMQSHHNILTPWEDEVKRSIEEYAAMDLRLHVTEMDISFYDDLFGESREITSADEEKQFKMYEDLFAIYRSYSDVIDNVTLWGVSDDCSWLNRPERRNTALPFDENKQPKAVVKALIDAAK